MGRRVRHFNPAHMGATMALDARFITGLANGAAVANWNSRRPATLDTTQSTSARRPVFATYGVGGSQTVNVTAASQQYMILSQTLVSPTTLAEYAIFLAGQTPGTVPLGSNTTTTWYGARPSGYTLGFNRSTFEIVNSFSVTSSAQNATAPIPGVVAGRRSGSAQIALHRTLSEAETTATTGTTADLRTIDTGNPANYAGGDLCAMSYIPAATTRSQRNRILEHYSRSFKLAI